MLDQYMVYAKPANVDGEAICYVMTLANTNKEHNFVSITRRVVINSSIWVMIVAVVAAYIITERIVKPLRKMTAATKSFAEGDFSTRVDVDKHNIEIAELAKAFNVTNIPMVALVKNNTFVDMSIGFVPKENISRLIEENK